MAAKKDSSSTTPQAFKAMLDSGRIPRVCLMDGEEESLKDNALQALRKIILPAGLEQLNEAVMENPPYDELVAACETLPFMADRRLIIVQEQDGFVSKADCDPRLSDYLNTLPESTVLVFFQRGTVNKSRALCKRIKSCGVIVTFSRMEARELGGWVQQRFAQNEKQCSPATAAKLVFTCGTDTGVLQAEVDKLTAYTADRNTITDADVDALATRSLECTVFQMIDALIAQQNAKALRLMQDMLTNGESRAGILVMLLRQFRLMQHLKIMQYEKVPPEDMSKAMKLSDYQLEMLRRQARNYTGGQVRRGVDICLDTEYRFKSGQINEEGSLESALLRLMALKS